MLHVLWLIVYPGLAAPTDDEQNGDGIYLGIYQRRDRVHGVPQPAVLQIDRRGLAGCQVIPGSQTNGTSLIGSYDVLLPHTQGSYQPVAKPFELGIGDSGIEGKPTLL